jgi:hypothetical protein
MFTLTKSSLATSCMHPHKSAPIAALPRRVPCPWNCRPSAFKVILRRPQEPPPPKPLSPRVRSASTVLRARSRSTVLTPSTPLIASVFCACASAMHSRNGTQGRSATCTSQPLTPPGPRPDLALALEERNVNAAAILDPCPPSVAPPRRPRLPSVREGH